MKDQTQILDSASYNKTTSVPLRWRFTFLAGSALACLAFSPVLKAVSPPPDGGYPNENTAEGEDALLVLTTGSFNTAVGFQALHANTTGSSNTADGDAALLSNTTGLRNNRCRSSRLIPEHDRRL